MSSTEPLLTVDEVARCCGVSRSAASRWLTADVPLPHRKVGALRVVVRPDDLVAWAAEHDMVLFHDPHEMARPFPRADEGVA